jgi:hypothetical protein
LDLKVWQCTFANIAFLIHTELGVYHGDVMWLSFVASAIAAVSLQYIDPFGTAKLVLFQVTHSDQPWRFFELIPWTILGIAGV